MAAVLPDETIRRISATVAACAAYRGRPQEDLRSDAMLGVAEALRAFDGRRGDLVSYAFMRAHYAVREGIRSSTPLTRGDYARGVVRQRVPLDDVERRHGDPHAGDGFAAAEARVCLRGPLTRLTAKQRYAVEQYYWHGRTEAQIGALTHTSESSVSALLGAARRRMRRVLEGRPVSALPSPYTMDLSN